MQKEIVGKLIVQGQAYEMLEIAPRAIEWSRGVRQVLKDTAVEFLVVYNGFARYILVSGGFVIIPYPVPELEEVKYFDEEEEGDEIRAQIYDLKVGTQLLTNSD